MLHSCFYSGYMNILDVLKNKHSFAAVSEKYEGCYLDNFIVKVSAS